MAPFLAKQSEINNGLHILEHMHIRYDAYTFLLVLNVQCTDSNKLSTCDLEASQG